LTADKGIKPLVLSRLQQLHPNNATRDVNLYHGDQSLIPGHVHLVRSLGGPIFNLLIAGLCSALAIGIAPSFWSDLVASLISTNQFFGFGSFFPLPSVDGEVIWRELLRPIHERLKTKDVSPESMKKSRQPQVSQDKE